MPSTVPFHTRTHSARFATGLLCSPSRRSLRSSTVVSLKQVAACSRRIAVCNASADVQQQAQADAQHGPASQRPRTGEAPASEIQLVLPVSWELQIDEVVAKYDNMDERLDAMERQLLEMTRELRTNTASLTGGVTTISSGGTAGLPAPSGLSSRVASAPRTRAQQQRKQQQQEGGASDAESSQQGTQHSKGTVFVKEPADHPHAPGATTRAVTTSSGLMPPDAPRPREQVMHEGLTAAAEARAAQESATEEDSTEGEAHKGGLWDKEEHQGNLWGGSAIQRALEAAKDAALGIPQAALDSIPTPSSAKREKEKEKSKPKKEEEQQLPPAEHRAVELVEVDQELEAEKEEQFAAARARLMQRATASASAKQPTGQVPVAAAKVAVVADDEARARPEAEGARGTSGAGGDMLLPRESLYGFNKLQSAITELANSGYIESVKQLRETLLIQEWDMSNRHLAKRRGVAMFERYVAERDLVHEIGGYSVLTALYEDPDAVADLLPNDRMRMLARSMMEECLNERRVQLYFACNQTAKEMATLTSSGVGGRMLNPLKAGLSGAFGRIWGLVRSTFMPWTRWLPFG